MRSDFLLSTIGLAHIGGNQAPRGTRAARPSTLPQGPEVVDLRVIGLNQPITLAGNIVPILLSPDAETPFGQHESMLLNRTELGVFMGSPDGVSVGGSSWIKDDPSNGDVGLPASIIHNSMGYNVVDGVRADIDDDGRDEMILLTKTATMLRVFRFDLSGPNNAVDWELLDEFVPVFAAGGFEESLTVGDVDGDKRDEIAVFRSIGSNYSTEKDSSYWDETSQRIRNRFYQQ